MDFRQVGSMGGKGSGPGRFAEALRGLALDCAGRICAVADRAVHVFDRAGAGVATWSLAGPGYCVAVSPQDRVYVGQAERIEVFDAAGELIETWRDARRLGLVTAIGFSQGITLAADARGRCIRRLGPHGEYQGDIGNDNKMRGFQIPNGIVDFSVDDAGTIHAANPGRHRIERYDVTGKLLGHFGRFDGRSPAGFAGCCNPTNVTVAGNGWTYVTEKAGPRAKVYDAENEFRAVIADDVFEPGCKNMDIVVAADGRVYVTDTVRLTILIFEPVPAAHVQPAAAATPVEANTP
jgi:hypothetical protein